MAGFRFGVFELDVERGELRKSGLVVRLQSQPLRLLGLLVERAGEVVSREEIQRHVWARDTHVDFDQGINACVKQVRAALGDSAGGSRFIETLPRQGYRFVAPLERIDEPAGAPTARSSFRRIGLAAALVVVALAVLLSLARGWFGSSGSGTLRPVLAVLPFELYGGGQEDLDFSDALTDELITQLGRHYGTRLAVIARTSVMKYQGSERGIDEIARDLGADYALEGSVRRVGSKMRIVAQLIRAEDESHVWASAFQRESDDLMQLQVELGETISRGLALKLVPDAYEMSGATRPEVYAAYLRGRHLAASSGPDESVPHFERALELDPGFAPAWSALAQAYRRSRSVPDGVQKARVALERALALDDELPEAYFALAMIRLYQDFDREGARRAFERAIELNPAYATAHHNLAAYYSITGQHQEAIASVQRARKLDPLSSMVNSDVGWYYYFARRYDEAIEHSRRTLELDPGFYWAKLCIQLSYLQRSDRQSALPFARRDAEELHAPEELLASLRAGAETAMSDYWRWRLERVRRAVRRGNASPAALAQVQMALGQEEEALDNLEAAFEQRSGWILPFLTVDPLFDDLRGDPRFDDLVERIAAGGRRLTSRAVHRTPR